MTDEGYRHTLSPEQRQMSDRALAATLREGEALSVLKRGPWDVCMDRHRNWFVTDSSTGPDHKPSVVYRASSRKDAEHWVDFSAGVYFALKHQQPEWPWEM